MLSGSPVTLARFAIAVGATPKWVQNAAAVLGFRLEYTAPEARRLGLARLLHEEFDVKLDRAWTMAESALFPSGRVAILSEDGAVRVIVDVERYVSDFAARLAVARVHYEPARRGRPSRRRRPSSAVERARRAGIDVAGLEESRRRPPGERWRRLAAARAANGGEGVGGRFLEAIEALAAAGIWTVVIGDVAAVAHGSPRIPAQLEICFDGGEDNVASLAQILACWRPYPRQVEPGLPFKLDGRTLTNAEAVPLATDMGPVDVFRSIVGVGDYAACAAASEPVEVGNLGFQALGLDALIAWRRASGRPRDLHDLLELEALRELQEIAES